MPLDALPLISQTFDHGQVTELRHAVASCAEASGLTGQRLDDLVLAVNELLTNAVRHGGGQGSLRMWRTNGAVVCEVSDHGSGIEPQRLTDRRRPAPDVSGGWGLWLARKLSDDLVVRTSPAGTTVLISMKIVRVESMDGHRRGEHKQADGGDIRRS
jgi:anti-sigma regulatory factor (Ser/Thr protein kinase)